MVGLNLNNDEGQILASILIAARDGFKMELLGKGVGRGIPDKRRALALAEGVAVCDKVLASWGMSNPPPAKMG